MEHERRGILHNEYGIVEKDGIFFHSPSAFAQRNLFYPLWGATYTCVPPYRVERTEGFDAYILFYIVEGCMDFVYQGVHTSAAEGSVVLMDCNLYNLYYVRALTKFHWFHFNGNASRAYCARLTNECGPVFEKQFTLAPVFRLILDALSRGQDEDGLSAHIHQVFSSLCTSLNHEMLYSMPIFRAKQWVETHFREAVSLDDLAAVAMLSRYHFSRQFHAEVGLSPHAYLVQIRLDYAKQRLAETSDTVEQIAEDCAFSSASNFIRAFRQQTGITPFKFRQLFWGGKG